MSTTRDSISSVEKRTMKVLITGGEGQLGQELVKVFQKDWEVVSTNHQTLDITDKKQTEELINKEKPQVVVHSAAWTDVEGCAKDPGKANLVNGEGTKNVAEVVKKVNGKLVYISTNEVFDGKKKEPYLETDSTNPINSYGKSKAAGENYCLNILGEKCIIVRTSWLYGPLGAKNFPTKIVSVADDKKEVSVVDDEVSSPTYTPDLAIAIKDLIGKKAKGVYHLVNEGFCSRFEWAKRVLELSGRGFVQVHPIKFKDFNRLSTPPLYCILQNSRARRMDIVLPYWEEGLQDFFEKRPDLIIKTAEANEKN